MSSVHSKKSHLNSALNQSQLSQREQLKGVVMGRFIRDYGRGHPIRQKLIRECVDQFFQHEKITEDSLRALKAKVSKL
jgi:hypothetical protein